MPIASSLIRPESQWNINLTFPVKDITLSTQTLTGPRTISSPFGPKRIMLRNAQFRSE